MVHPRVSSVDGQTYNTHDSTAPLRSTSQYKSTTGGIYVVYTFFCRQFIAGGALNTTPLFGRTPENILISKLTPGGGHSPIKRKRTGMDTGTSMEPTAPHYSGPIEPAARTPAAPTAAAPRARITSFCAGSTPPTVTGTGAATSALAQTSTTGTSNEW